MELRRTHSHGVLKASLTNLPVLKAWRDFGYQDVSVAKDGVPFGDLLEWARHLMARRTGFRVQVSHGYEGHGIFR